MVKPLVRLSKEDNQSDESAEAIAGMEATAAPIPKPTASMPTQAIPRAFTIDFPFPRRAAKRRGTFVVSTVG